MLQKSDSLLKKLVMKANILPAPIWRAEFLEALLILVFVWCFPITVAVAAILSAIIGSVDDFWVTLDNFPISIAVYFLLWIGIAFPVLSKTQLVKNRESRLKNLVDEKLNTIQRHTELMKNPSADVEEYTRVNSKLRTEIGEHVDELLNITGLLYTGKLYKA
jgi:hypothetical protein